MSLFTEKRREGFSSGYWRCGLGPLFRAPALDVRHDIHTPAPNLCMPRQSVYFQAAVQSLYPTSSCRRAKSPFLGGIERGGSGRVVHAAVPRDPAKVPPPFLRRKDPFRVQVSALMRIPPLTAPLQYRYNGSCQ